MIVELLVNCMLCHLARSGCCAVLQCVIICHAGINHLVCCVMLQHVLHFELCNPLPAHLIETMSRHIIDIVLLYYVSVCHNGKDQVAYLYYFISWHIVAIVLCCVRRKIKPLTYGRRSVAAMLTRTTR